MLHYIYQIHVDGNGPNVNLSKTHALMNCLNFLQALRYLYLSDLETRHSLKTMDLRQSRHLLKF